MDSSASMSTQHFYQYTILMLRAVICKGPIFLSIGLVCEGSGWTVGPLPIPLFIGQIDLVQYNYTIININIIIIIITEPRHPWASYGARVREDYMELFVLFPFHMLVFYPFTFLPPTICIHSIACLYNHGTLVHEKKTFSMSTTSTSTSTSTSNCRHVDGLSFFFLPFFDEHVAMALVVSLELGGKSYVENKRLV